MNTSKYWDAHRVQLIFVALLFIITLAAFGLIWMYQFFPKNISMPEDIIIDKYRNLLLPESTEKFVFVLLASIVPILVLILAMMPWKRCEIKSSTFFSLTQKFLPFLVAVLLFIPFIGSEFVIILVGAYGKISSYDNSSVVVILSILSSATACIWLIFARRFHTRKKWGISPVLVAWIIFLSAVAIQLFAWRLIGIASVTRLGVWSVHADPLFYALSQVVAGKTLLVDLPSQYGLFPEILAPIFKVIRLSVFNLSAIFAVMQVVSLVAVYFVLSRLLVSRLLLIVTGVALVTLTFESVVYFAGFEERYYQYWPIRFFWPAISVLGFYFFAHRRTLIRGCLVSLIGSISIIWNFDTGLFIIIGYGAYLVARLITVLPICRQLLRLEVVDRWSPKDYSAAIVFHVLITLVIVTGFLTVLSWKAQQSLDLFLLFKYQKIFYSLGFMMLPLPRQLDPWMSVLGVYLLGLVTSLVAWRHRAPQVRDDVLFYLSMLGIGLFVYYQGRSHVLNLVNVFWPVILIGALLADESLRALRARLLPMTQIWLPIAAISLLFLACASFIIHVPDLLRDTVKRFTTRGVTEEKFVSDELAFIRRHAVGQRECLILSQRQGIYYAESGLASPLKGPGLAEMILTTDQDQLVANILSGDIRCIFLGIGEFSYAGFKLDMQKMQKKYSIISKNSQNTMQYLEPKS